MSTDLGESLENSKPVNLIYMSYSCEAAFDPFEPWQASPALVSFTWVKLKLHFIFPSIGMLANVWRWLFTTSFTGMVFDRSLV